MSRSVIVYFNFDNKKEHIWTAVEIYANNFQRDNNNILDVRYVTLVK